MKCPVCDINSFENKTLESNLQVLECGQCGGYWLKSYQYWRWREKVIHQLPTKPKEEALELPVQDSEAGKICPECSTFLLRYDVGMDVTFHLDKCGHCGGIWFDRNEWEILKSRNLHDDIHYIFSFFWQKKLIQETINEKKLSLLKKDMGDDFEKLVSIKTWINDHPVKDRIISFILYGES